MPIPQNSSFSDKLVEIMATLRSQKGCPWDREQTHETLRPYLLEESYEVLEALDDQNPAALKEELGDLLLQVLFHAQIASEQGQFNFEDICETLVKKLIHRHPHVFEGDSAARNIQSASDVVNQWDRLKRQEKNGESGSESQLAGVPKTFPALARAYQMQKRAARAGFDWHTIEPVLEKFREELEELSSATTQLTQLEKKNQTFSPRAQEEVEAELGDVLFSLVNLSRFLHINPEEALRKTTNRFQRRFIHVEQQAAKAGKTLKSCSLEEMDRWWESAKDEERLKASRQSPLANKEHPT